LSEIEKLAEKADKVVLLTGLNPDWEGEGSDRINMRLPRRQEDLVRLLAKTGKKVVMVNQSGTPVDLRCAEGVAGIVQAFYGGMESGNGEAALDILPPRC
jgi:beta-glucosidase